MAHPRDPRDPFAERFRNTPEYIAVYEEAWARAEALFPGALQHSPTSNCLFLYLASVNDGPTRIENRAGYRAHLESNWQHYLDERDVVGRLQEGVSLCFLVAEVKSLDGSLC